MNNKQNYKVSFSNNTFLSGLSMKAWINIFLSTNRFQFNLSINLQIKLSSNIGIKLLPYLGNSFHLWQKIFPLRKHPFSLCMIWFKWFIWNVFFLGRIMVIISTILNLRKVLSNFIKKIWQEILQNHNRKNGRKWFYMKFPLFYP